MMGMREKVADAVQAELNRHTARAYRDTITDAVMAVVEEEMADYGRAVGEAEAFKVLALELRMRVEARDTRLRELEEENQKLRRTVPDPDDLAIVLKLTDTHAHKVSRLWGPDGRSCDKCKARFRVNAALARARQLKEEK